MLNLKNWSNSLRVMLVVSMLATSCRFFGGAEDEGPVALPPTAATAQGSGESESAVLAATPAASPPTATAATSPTLAPTTTPLPTSPDRPAVGSAAELPSSALALPALPQAAAPPGALPSFNDTLTRASQMQPLLGQLESQIDAGQYDLLALNSALGFEGAALINHVQTEIAFEQYPGVLRGPEGTLISRAGSALDQALLLRQLLDDAGYETRLARTTVPDDLARTLINQIAVPRPATPPLGDEAAISATMDQIAALSHSSLNTFDLTPPDYASLAGEVTAADTAVILDGLAAAGIPLDHSELIPTLVAEARDYFWVQYRLSSFDDWDDAHPAFTDPAAAPNGLNPAETFRDGPPAELYHRLRIELFVEQKFDEELRVYPLLNSWEKTTAELIGQPITLQNQPNNLDLETAVTPADMLQKTGVLLPIINGEMADHVFDLDGRVFGAGLVSLDTVGMTELFQSAAAGAEGATSLLGDLGADEQRNPDDLLTLTAHWIDYTVIGPDGRETTTRRFVMDRIGAENRAAGQAVITDETPLLEAAQALLSTYTISVLPGEYNRAYRAHRAIERTMTELDLLAFINPDGTLISFPDQVIADLKPLHDVLLSGAFANGSTGQTIAYRPSPTVVVHEQGFVPGADPPTAFERVDVLYNGRRVFDVSTGQPQPDPAAAVQIGVWETFAEQILLQGVGQPPDGALKAMRAAADAGATLRVIPPHQPEQLATLPHSSATLASAAADLAAGYVIIIPERPAESGAPTGWWRVDPHTGETLGIGTGGYGAAYVEYLISLKLGALFAVAGYNNCRSAGGSSGCCLYENLALLAIGFTIGFWIGQIALAAGAAAEAGAGLGLVLGDVGLGTAGLFNPISICT